eukprot:4631443-Prymnesium_polylepis.1
MALSAVGHARTDTTRLGISGSRVRHAPSTAWPGTPCSRCDARPHARSRRSPRHPAPLPPRRCSRSAPAARRRRMMSRSSTTRSSCTRCMRSAVGCRRWCCGSRRRTARCDCTRR